jgi:hypothetical protein
MDDEKYKKWLDDERARRAFIERETPYEPADMESKVPLGCTLAAIAAFIVVSWIAFKLIVSFIKG